jgi:hypothetical protein
MEKLKASTTLIVLGIALLAIGAFYPFVTLVVDTTGPEIAGTTPANGVVYAQLTSLDVHCRDLESGVKSVQMVINGSSYGLKYQAASPNYPNYDWWTKDLSYTPINTPGTYTYTVTVTNNAGLQTSQSGTFTIYTQLQGNWYINGQQITSTSQTVYSTSTTVSFKFQKTAGIADSYITCWVEEGGTKILTLTLTDTTNHIWTGSYTFSAGTHTLSLKAYDGTTTITYSIVGLTIPGAVVWVMTTQQALVLAGVLALVAGVVMRVKKY